MNPLDLKRKEQREEGYAWFAAHDMFMMEDRMREILSRPNLNQCSSFPSVSPFGVKLITEILGNGINSFIRLWLVLWIM